MILSSTVRPVVACALLLALTAPTRADRIPYKFDWTPTPLVVPAGTGGSVQLSDEPERNAIGDSSVLAGNFQFFSTAEPEAPDRFGLFEGYFSMALKLTDLDSGRSGTLTFPGQFRGWFWKSSNPAYPVFAFPGPQSIVLGTHEYTVDYVYGRTYGIQGGHMGASIFIRDVKESPEPSSLVLGVGAVALAALRRWRKAIV